MIGATYRLQFRGGLGFDEAAALVPHLAAAGITHLYASPIFAATEDSTHGYDVTDHNAFDPSLGGEEGFLRLSAALRAHGLKLLLDIVPNHMAASPQNPWWRDVLKHGPHSRYARHFDIDWSAPRLILPVLGKPFGAALADGDIARADHPEWGPVLTVYDMAFPLRPGTEAIADVGACHEAQHYRLAHWRLGRDGLTYRRFFEITGLVGVRVEDPVVFADVHRLTARLIAEGHVDALRIDHVDGLADPAAYLAALREKFDVPVVVEKILEPGEALPDWPVDGTTGYEFILALAGLFVDPQGLATMARHYATTAADDIAAMTHRAKHEIVNRNLSGELLRLTDLALGVFANDLSQRDHGPFTVREGLSALLAGMPVYRTYVAGVASPTDRAHLAEAVAVAERESLEDPTVLADLVAAMLSNDPRPVAQEFITRFQQTSGPAMAKAVEDTLFFRHHRFVGLNEVGSSATPALGEAPFLAAAREKGLAATQTHDTKRGEDARARLYALSDPLALPRFTALAGGLPGDIAPGLKWGLAQMLFASQPLRPDPDFPQRFRQTALKTIREAKEETSWTAQNADFEARVASFAEALAAGPDPFVDLADVVRAGGVIGLGQALLKAIGRRAPDIYQGTLGWDLSMVDPDNRRPVDFAAEAALADTARRTAPDALMAEWTSGAIKARVVLEALAVRRERPALFAEGGIRPAVIKGAGQGLSAFVCEHGGDRAVAILANRPLGLLKTSGLSLAPPQGVVWGEKQGLKNRFTGVALAAGDSLVPHLSAFPVVLATSF